jgi:threonine/homoserine/homoserine lactone efflux protein
VTDFSADIEKEPLMSFEILLGLALFAFVSSITPGPNNLMLMASGANFGYRKTLPHIMGVWIGFTVMIVLVGVGIVQIFDTYPQSYQILKVVSVAYLLYLAWKIANAGPISGNCEAAGKPFSFMQAALFQWVNPKAWSMGLTAISIYSPTQSVQAVLLLAAVFAAFNLPCISLWTVLGQQLQRVLTSQRRLRAFNWTMAGLLVVSLYPVLRP